MLERERLPGDGEDTKLGGDHRPLSLPINQKSKSVLSQASRNGQCFHRS